MHQTPATVELNGADVAGDEVDIYTPSLTVVNLASQPDHEHRSVEPYQPRQPSVGRLLSFVDVVESQDI